MLPPPPGSIDPYLSNFQGNGLSYGSNIAPWAAGWVGPDSSAYSAPSASMMGVGALQGGMGGVGNYSGSGWGSGSDSDPYTMKQAQPIQTKGDASSVPATNLGAVNVSASVPSGLGALSGLQSLAGSGQVSGGGASPGGGLHVQNLAPVNVKAQMPAPTSALDNAWMWSNDHPVLSNIIQGVASSIPGLAPVMVTANAYENAKHGINPLSSLIPFGSSLSSLFGGMTSSSGPASSKDANASLLGLLGSSGNLGLPGNSPSNNGGMPPSSISTSGPLPDYAGLASLAGFGNALTGGYWNQQALKMANPAYGPYAGYGGTPQPINYANPYAPTGVATSGY